MSRAEEPKKVVTVNLEDVGRSEEPRAAGEQLFSGASGKERVTMAVPRGTTILDAPRSRGVPAPSSCESGTCGSCRTTLLAGKVDHRDYVLDDDEHESDIMICGSRAQAGCDQLVLDL
jgi:phthalate 4,5-dioxygenase reductase subunit